MYRRRAHHPTTSHFPLWLAALLAVISLATVMLWSWRGGGNTPNAAAPQEIVFWNAQLFGDEVYTALHQFEIQNPQYKVIASTSLSRDMTGDAQRLLSAIAGGVPPDLVGFDRAAIGEWAARGALTDLTPFMQAQRIDDPCRIDLNDYYPMTITEASYSKLGSGQLPRLYGIPTNVDVRLLFCNCDQLRQEGLVNPVTGQPSPPKTWDQLRAYANRLTRRDQNQMITRLGFAPNFGNSWLYLYAFQAGGNLLSSDGMHVTMDSPPVVRALRFMTDIYDDLGGAQQVNAFQSGLQTGQLDPFLTGKVSMKIDVNGLIATICNWNRDMDFLVAPPPMPADRLAAGVGPVTWSGGFSLVIPSTSRQKEGAFKLLQFLVSRPTYRFLEQTTRESREADGQLYIPLPQANRRFYEEIAREMITDNPDVPPNVRQAYDVINQLLLRTRSKPPSPVGQLLWNQHVRAYDAAVNHEFAAPGRDKDAEVKLCLTTMQADVQRQLSALLAPPPPLVCWRPYFIAYIGVVIAAFAALVLLYKIRRRAYGYKARELGAAIFFASPWLLGMICLTGGPILFSAVLSFTRYDVLGPARYVNTSNYAEVLHDPVFYKSLENTAFMLIRIPLMMAAGLAIALLLNRPMRGIGHYRTAFYMPTIVPMVAASLLWAFLLNPDFGAVNLLLNSLFSTFPFRDLQWLLNHLHHFSGGPFRFSPPAWLQDPRWSKPSLILMSLWTTGGGMIIWLAGLQSIPRQLYEAAMIDGNGRWGQFRHVTLPMLSPYILFNCVIGLIGTMQIFGEAYVMTAGGPADSTLFYAYYLFREAFQYFRMGYASALAWILFLIVLALTLLQLWTSRGWVHYDRT